MKSFTDIFDFGDQLGEGGYGFVFKAVNKSDMKEYAIKQIELRPGEEEIILRETETHSKLSHKNIVRYHSHFTSYDGESLNKFSNITPFDLHYY